MLLTFLGSISGLAGIPAILIPIIIQKVWQEIRVHHNLSLVDGGMDHGIQSNQSFYGLSTNSLLPVCFMGMTEMMAPKYRAHAMQTFGNAKGIGMATCATLGRYFIYSIVATIMLVPIVVTTEGALG